MNARPSTKEQASTPVILTASDVERLLKDDSADSRVSVLEKVSRTYNSGEFADREREIAEHIFRLLMKDTALRVRETLADRIKENESVPHDIVMHMANDVESVALPVLEKTKVLSDADFVRIIEATRDLEKLTVISRREGVSERISEALVETNYPSVITSLLANEDAAITERALGKIVDGFRGEPGVLEAMAEREPLPMTLVERLVNEAGSAVALQLKAKYALSDEQLSRHTAGAQDDMMLRMLRHDLGDAEVMALVGQMAGMGRLTASLIMTALARGQLTFFTAALAHHAHIPLSNARKLVADKGEFGFKGIYNKSGLPDTMFEAIKLILQAVKEMEGGEALPGSLTHANQLAQRVLTLSQGRDVEYLPYFIAMIRQNIARH